MNVNELIEQLRKLPKEVREQPIMDGKPNVGYRSGVLSIRRIEETKKQLDKYVSQYEALCEERYPRQTSGTELVGKLLV